MLKVTAGFEMRCGVLLTSDFGRKGLAVRIIVGITIKVWEEKGPDMGHGGFNSGGPRIQISKVASHGIPEDRTGIRTRIRRGRKIMSTA